ncbi:hypothetical protein LCGC14_2731410 [marine sediment metagenome]|uniref:Uncharacterized protein n=1 Tax=marine sediment metagenome TaxID=412755 RepID=A0A0F9BYW1_9ZZZZ
MELISRVGFDNSLATLRLNGEPTRLSYAMPLRLRRIIPRGGFVDAVAG